LLAGTAGPVDLHTPDFGLPAKPEMNAFIARGCVAPRRADEAKLLCARFGHNADSRPNTIAVAAHADRIHYQPVLTGSPRSTRPVLAVHRNIDIAVVVQVTERRSSRRAATVERTRDCSRRAPANGTKSNIASSLSSENWRGKPLISHEVIVNLIAATTTDTGLVVHSGIDKTSYPAGIKVSDKEIAGLNLRRDKFHGDWNYSLPATCHQNRIVYFVTVH
jgi:Rhodopirellula transposase DDE domain